MNLDQNIHVLLVEDSLTQALTYKNMLIKAGFKVTLCENGLEALDFLTKEKVNIVLSDIMMPIMDGFDLCYKIKTDPDLKNIPVVLLTILTDLESVIRSLNCGADNYLKKPFDEESLISITKSMILFPQSNDEELFIKDLNLYGNTYKVNARPSQMLNLLLTLYSDIVDKNDELSEVNDELMLAREELKKANNELKNKLFELKSSEDRFRSLVATIPDIVYKVNVDGIFTFVNDAVKKIGYDPEELLGKHFSSIIIPEQVEKVSRKIVLDKINQEKTTSKNPPKLFDERRSGDRKTMDLEVSLITKNGAYIKEATLKNLGRDTIIAEINSSGLFEKLSDNETLLIGTVGVIHDISQHKILAKQLEDARKEAEKSNKVKSQFLANMSHEIRTPMNAIIGLNYMLQKTELSDKQFGYIKKIENSSKNLLGIINDILDFSKIEAGKLNVEYENFNLFDLLDNLANLLNVKISEKDLKLFFDIDNEIPVFLLGDSLRLGQILLNIGGNAVKFTKSGEIVLSAKLISKTIDRVTIKFSVKDKGIGLTKEQKDKLFKPFSQADTSTTRKYGGTGLGLAITKSLIEMMGGKINVRSESGVGSTFYFVLEFGIDQKSQKEKIEIPPELRNLKVLLIDDEKIELDIVKKYLKYFNYYVKSLTSYDKIIEELKKKKFENKYDLVILNWKQDVFDKINVIDSIHKNLSIEMVPKIITMINYENEKRLNGLYNDEQIFLLKPVTRPHLYNTIRQAFGLEINEEFQKTLFDKKLFTKIKQISGANILLVEDNEINQQVAKEILEQEGIRVEVVDDGRKAVDILENNADNTFDVVLMDLHLPELNGYEATKLLRANKRFKDLVIIAMTADAIAGVKEKVIESGMNDYVTKPINVTDFFTILLNWIKPFNNKNFSNMENNNQETKMDLPYISGIDVKAGLNRLVGNVDLYYKLLMSFKENNKNSLDRIILLINDNNYINAEKEVHTLKGTSGNLGFYELYANLDGLDIELKKENDLDLEKIKEYLVFTEKELDKVFNGLIKLENSLGEYICDDTKSLKIINKSEVLTILDELNRHLIAYDTVANDDFNFLKKQLAVNYFGNYMKQLENEITNFEYDRAIEVVKEIYEEINKLN